MVKPWGWYLMLLSYPVGFLLRLPYLLLSQPAIWTFTWVLLWWPPLIVWSLLTFAYFYKRRAMFGARWRWRLLERWCPMVVGPEARPGDFRPGFQGLPFQETVPLSFGRRDSHLGREPPAVKKAGGCHTGVTHPDLPSETASTRRGSRRLPPLGGAENTACFSSDRQRHRPLVNNVDVACLA